MDTPMAMLLDELAQLGVTVRVDGGRLLCTPSENLTDDLRSRLRLAKAELIRAFNGWRETKSREVISDETDKTARSADATPSVSSVGPFADGWRKNQQRAEAQSGAGIPRTVLLEADRTAKSVAATDDAVGVPVGVRPKRRARSGRPASFSKVPKEGTDKSDGSSSDVPSGSAVGSTKVVGQNPRAPLMPCRACGSSTFWALKGGATWICNGCHETDFQPDQVEWHVVEDARRIMAVTRPKIGCPKCKFSGFVTLVGGRWTVCVCNDGFDRRVAGETDGADA